METKSVECLRELAILTAILKGNDDPGVVLATWAADEIERLRTVVDCGKVDLLISASELQQASDIVDKLEKTDDGVPVVPGQTYYTSYRNQCEEGAPWVVSPCRYVGHCRPICDYKWEVEHWPYDDGGVDVESFTVWSTREAAEAAEKDSD